jgi:hypothetical protein
MAKYIFTRPDGGVSIVNPAAKADVEKLTGPMTDEEFEAHIQARSIPKDATNVRVINDADIPQSREFRNAWVDSEPGTQVDIHCEKARDIALEKLREARKPLLQAQDELFMRALEAGSDTTAIVAEKQRLRDITNTLKGLDVSGRVNDNAILAQIRTQRDILN